MIEAMVKGLPPVALNEGDVSLGAGTDFLPGQLSGNGAKDFSIEGRCSILSKYESESLQERAKVMLDGTTAF